LVVVVDHNNLISKGFEVWFGLLGLLCEASSFASTAPRILTVLERMINGCDVSLMKWAKCCARPPLPAIAILIIVIAMYTIETV
jgi:hypothetical protein